MWQLQLFLEQNDDSIHRYIDENSQFSKLMYVTYMYTARSLMLGLSTFCSLSVYNVTDVIDHLSCWRLTTRVIIWSYNCFAVAAGVSLTSTVFDVGCYCCYYAACHYIITRVHFS